MCAAERVKKDRAAAVLLLIFLSLHNVTWARLSLSRAHMEKYMASGDFDDDHQKMGVSGGSLSHTIAFIYPTHTLSEIYIQRNK